MKRCAACGGFFDADECPRDHSHIEEYVPPIPTPYAELRGRVCFARWPGSDTHVLGVVIDNEDADGSVGFYALSSNVRIPVQDLKEIVDASPAP